MPGPSTRRESQPPSLALLALEPWRAAIDFTASLVGRSPPATGDGHAVLVLPGLGAGDWSTLRLRRVLGRAGFEAIEWGLGLNRGPQGDLDEWLQGLEAKVRALHGRSGRKVSLLGWSLGGLYARELGKSVPQFVRQVITLGSPFADPLASHAGAAYRLLNRGGAQLSPELERRLRRDPRVPTSAIYSRTDGVVAWRSCMLRESAVSENIEASWASHCGMGAHPRVLRIVVDRLSQPEGRWQRWRHPAKACRTMPGLQPGM